MNKIKELIDKLNVWQLSVVLALFAIVFVSTFVLIGFFLPGVLIVGVVGCVLGVVCYTLAVEIKRGDER